MEKFANRYEKILSLETLACINVGHQLCYACLKNGAEWDTYNTKITTSTLCNLDDDDFDLGINISREKSIYADVVKSIQHLPIPNVIKMQIKSCIRLVLTQVKSWMNYHEHKHKIFNQHEKGAIINFINDIIWKPDGEINYYATAIKMLSSSKLSDGEKFLIMSLYCLVEELEKSCVSIVDTDGWLHKQLMNEPLLEYWYDYMKNGFLKHGGSTSQLVRKFHQADNVCAYWYFWNLLMPDEQTFAAVQLLGGTSLLNHRIAFLSLINESQRCEVFKAIGERIIVDCAKQRLFLRHGQLIWTEMRNIMSESQYYYMIQKLIHCESYVENFLADIWLSTPNNLKPLCLNVENGVVLKYLISYVHVLDLDFGNRIFFLLQILRDMKDIEKEIVFNKLVFRMKRLDEPFKLFKYTSRSNVTYDARTPWLLNEFLSSCLPTAEEQLKFRKLWLNPRICKYYCCQYLLEGNLKDLNAFVKLYMPEVDINKLKVKLLLQANDKYHNVLRKLIYLKKYDHFIQVVDEVFPDSDEAVKVRKNLFLYERCFKEWLLAGRIDYIKECIEQVLRPQDIDDIKHHLISYYSVNKRFAEIFFALHESQQFEGFLMWCFNENLTHISEYKRSLDAGGIIIALLEVWMECYVTDENDVYFEPYARNDKGYELSTIDDFLIWCFGSVKQAKEFKRLEVDKFCQIDCTLWSHRLGSDNFRSRVHRIILWFFDVNEGEIQKFMWRIRSDASLYQYIIPICSKCNKM